MTLQTHHNRWDTSGRGFSPSQKALLGNIQHSTETDKHNLTGFEPTVPANELPHNHTLDHVAFDIG
jgi:hypothetical protein